jgi:DNA-binding transcriptional regulator YdaS (Cro superfamily)
MSNRMNAKLRPEGLLRAGQDGSPAVNPQVDLPIGEVAAERAKRREAVTYERNAVVAKWLDAALDSHPKAGSVAAECGISEAYLSQMRGGERTIPAHLLLSLLDWTPSAQVLLASMATHNGKLTVQPLRKVDPEFARRRYIERARKVAIIHAALRAEVAADCGTTEEEIDWAIEDTAVRQAGGGR